METLPNSSGVPHLPHPLTYGTRRKFLKTTALSVGAITLLSQGRALAVEEELSSTGDKTAISRGNPTGNVDATPETSSLGSIEIKEYDVGVPPSPDVLVSTETVVVRWIFKHKVDISGDSQPVLTKRDCAKCEVKGVLLEIEIVSNTITTATLKTQVENAIKSAIGTNPLGVIPGPTLTRGITFKDASPNVTNLKCATEGILGDADITANGIQIALAGVVTPAEAGPTKTVTWTTTPTFSLNAAHYNAAIATGLNNLKAFKTTNQKKFVITVILPAPSATGYNRARSWTAIRTSVEAGGTGCPLNL